MGSPLNVGSYVAGAKAALNRWGHSDVDVYYTLRAMGLKESEIAHIAKDERLEKEKWPKAIDKQKSNTKQVNP